MPFEERSRPPRLGVHRCVTGIDGFCVVEATHARPVAWTIARPIESIVPAAAVATATGLATASPILDATATTAVTVWDATMPLHKFPESGQGAVDIGRGQQAPLVSISMYDTTVISIPATTTIATAVAGAAATAATAATHATLALRRFDTDAGNKPSGEERGCGTR